LDYDKQKLAEQVITSSDGDLKRYGATNAALISLDPKNGQILTMVGSKNYYDDTIDGQVNVTTRPRQPGSSFKPFAYATAFEKGYQPETKILDAQTDFGIDGSGRHYIPRNYDGKFHGVVTIRQALAMSLNVPAVKTLSLAGVPDTIAMAHRLGITTLNDTNRYGLSLVLGGGEVKLLDETVGYSVFANDGKKNLPTSILRVTDSRGKNIYTSSAQNTQVIDPQIARKIDSILSDNAARVPIFGPNNKLFIPGKIVAAKTGTTSEFKDAWTVGFTPDIATGVWAGNDNNFPMHAGADGSYVAAPIWNKFMSQVLNDYPVQPFTDYEKVEDINKPAPDIIEKITYTRKNSGKKISEKKAKKMPADKVEIHVEYIPVP
jgi:membrane peptidoglycan carboxypeptidase